MKTRIVLYALIALMVFTSCTHSQLRGSYGYFDSTQYSDLEIAYRLSLYHDNHYCLSVSLESVDWCHEQFLSLGTYKTCRNHLILKNEENGQIMKFLIQEDQLVPLVTVDGLCGKALTPCISTCDLGKQKKRDANFNVENQIEMAKRYGSIHNFMIDFEENGQYLYSCFGKTVSKGKWERQDNSIFLYDKNIEKPFVGIIKKDRIEIFEDEIGASE